MNVPRRLGGIGRRDVVLGSAAAGTLLTLLGTAAGWAQQPQPGALPVTPPQLPPAPKPTQVTWQEAMRDMIGEVQPIEGQGRIKFDLPAEAENGNVIPFTLTVDSPMSQQEFVKAVHIWATANPKPDVASAYFSPLSGKAIFGGRLRLGRSQEVIAVAEFSDGQVHLTRRAVQVTIGGCGSG